MVFHGTFRGGVVVPDEKVELPEGQRVRMDVEVPEPPEGEPAVWQELLKLSGTIKSGRRDESVNHDHYIYGAPKREPEA